MYKSMNVVALYICLILFHQNPVDAKIGVTWGRQAPTSFVPSVLVDLLLQNNVTYVKLYNFNSDVISSFAGTQIAVTLCIPDALKVDSSESALDFVTAKIKPFPTVNFQYVQVGNNAFRDARAARQPYSSIVRALKLVQSALDELGFNNIKAFLEHSLSGVLSLNITRPSDASFYPDVSDDMLEMLRFTNFTNAPFIFQTFPILALDLFRVDFDFGFFDNKSSTIIDDINGISYTNLFDFIYDSFAWALKKVGFGNMKIVVGLVGWPTDGYKGADVKSAERFHKGLLPHVTSNKGTPMKPGAPIDTFVHSLTDEKTNPGFIPIMRHWGIYRSNGNPKYMIDLTGQGRQNVYPVTGKGINLLPARWCVFNGNITNPIVVEEQFRFACEGADCTCLAPGGSCSMLTHNENVSYAFNSYFQSNFQGENSCFFMGLGEVVANDPSRDGCVFLVEVVEGNQEPVTSTRWG